MNIRKRYSEFDELRHKLMMTFPNFDAAVPALPPKSVISKFRPRFLDQRRQGLQYFLKYEYPSDLPHASALTRSPAGWTRIILGAFRQAIVLTTCGHSCIMLNPEFSGSPILKEFLFS